MNTAPPPARPAGAEIAEEIAARVRSRPLGFADWFEAQAVRAPDAVLLISDGRTWSYAEVDQLADRIASAAAPLAPAGAAAALMLENSADTLAALIGFAKIGVALSLLDPELRGAPLAHALREVPPALILAEGRCAATLRECGAVSVPLVLRSEGVLRRDGTDWLTDLGPPPGPSRRAGVTPDDTIFHVFTSGTTGLPKAARCSHARYITSATSEAVLLGIDAADRVYVVLPMFHIAALSAIGAAVSVGGSVLLRARFSASRFWDDVRGHGVTAMQYLGEICRYVAARPPAANDRDHGLRAMIGAGMRPDTWRAFRDRFGVARIVECYGSSEGVCSLINLDGRIGSVGRPPPGSRMRIAQLAGDGRSLARDAQGALIECDVDEAGELIGGIDSEAAFEGYASADATKAKLIRDEAEGTLWFRTGDLFRRDADGYFYFVDRIGDSFRWKGENISAEQVAAAVGDCGGVARAVVYGVRVPGAEGRAGMALIEPAAGATFDPVDFGAALRMRLSPAALPLFLRIGAADALTATYKLQTGRLCAEGYGPAAGSDRLYLLDTSGSYVALDGAALVRNRLAPFGSDDD